VTITRVNAPVLSLLLPESPALLFLQLFALQQFVALDQIVQLNMLCMQNWWRKWLIRPLWPDISLQFDKRRWKKKKSSSRE
jgi:hypothetical protein